MIQNLISFFLFTQSNNSCFYFSKSYCCKKSEQYHKSNNSNKFQDIVDSLDYIQFNI